MVDNFIADMEYYLVKNRIGEMSEKLALNYIETSLIFYKKQVKEKEQLRAKALEIGKVNSFYGGVNPND